MYWTTKDGRKLKISEMKTSHILNCIRMMDRQMCAALAYITEWEKIRNSTKYGKILAFVTQ